MRKTLVMVPAFGCDAGLYAPVLPALSAHVNERVHVATEDRYEKMVAALLAQVPGSFIILGTSMGARLALEVTLAAPQRVDGLVMIGSGPGPVADQAAGLRRSERLRGGEMDQVLTEMGNIISHLPGPRGPDTRQAFIDMGRAMGPEALARQSDALAHRVDRWPALPGIACPVLCLWGVHDQFSPAADGRKIAEAVPKGSYVELAECGHFPTLEYPEATAAALLRWLQAALA
jgi:pimeloyl-ACP methyl ester carboxylesterase